MKSVKTLCVVFILVVNFLYGTSKNNFYVVLTFDDGPYPEYTEQILYILKKFNVKATFFLTGKHVKKFPEVVYKIYNEGHIIGLHGYNHIDYTKLSKSQILNEIKKVKMVTESIIGKNKIQYFRPPGGKYNKLVQQCCLEENLKMVMWTFYPLDYGEKNPHKILSRIKTHQFRQYEILLLHNGVPSTIEVLDEIIEFILSSGGKFITLHQYFDRIKYKKER
ncbi:MAG: polysaccharide deacetylase family protein [Endomicrobia bacterium]|nr:polysaccharide deacetylase family protein [Endomicrobiia bacterium]